MINLFGMLAILYLKALQQLRISIIVPTQEPILLAPKPSLAEGKRRNEPTLRINFNLYVVSMRHVLSQKFWLLSQQPQNFFLRLDPCHFFSALRVDLELKMGVNLVTGIRVVVEELNQIRYFWSGVFDIEIVFNWGLFVLVYLNRFGFLVVIFVAIHLRA